MDRVGGIYEDAFSLLLEAVQDNTIGADIKAQTAYDVENGWHLVEGTVEPLVTTVATVDLSTWLNVLCQAIDEAEAQPTTAAQASVTPSTDVEAALSELFDPVPVEALEKMFPAEGQWKKWAERAERNGLKAARDGRGRFNPHRAALWFMDQGIANWDIARCNRVLANNLPARSRHKADMLTTHLP
jgi:hypothetical protein